MADKVLSGFVHILLSDARVNFEAHFYRKRSAIVGLNTVASFVTTVNPRSKSNCCYFQVQLPPSPREPQRPPGRLCLLGGGRLRPGHQRRQHPPGLSPERVPARQDLGLREEPAVPARRHHGEADPLDRDDAGAGSGQDLRLLHEHPPQHPGRVRVLRGGRLPRAVPQSAAWRSADGLVALANVHHSQVRASRPNNL